MPVAEEVDAGPRRARRATSRRLPCTRRGRGAASSSSSATVDAPRSCASPMQAHEHLGRRLRVGQRAVARLDGDAEEERERGEARPLRRGRASRLRASGTVSITVAESRLPVSRSSSRLTKPTSKRALWATSTASPANAEKRRSASRDPRRAAQLARRRARSAGRPAPAAARRARRASGTSPPTSSRATRTAPISQIRADAVASPVVSRSKTTNVALLERAGRPPASATNDPRHDEPRVLLDQRLEQRPGEPLGCPAQAKSCAAASPRGTRPPRSSTSSTSRSSESNASCTEAHLSEHTFD